MTRTEKRAWWQETLAHWRESGQTQSSYCREHELNLAQFSYWKQRLSQSEPSTEVPSLIPVRLTDDDKKAAPDAGVIVELDNRVRLRLQRDFDAQVLVRAVEALRGR